MTSCSIPRLLVVFTRQLEILVTTLSQGIKQRGISFRSIYFSSFFHRKVAGVNLLPSPLVDRGSLLRRGLDS